MSLILRNSGCLSCGSRAIKTSKPFPISRNYAATTETEIVIPTRIPRGPTDILRALASTIKRDPTAAHYKFHDDPYLIPTSNKTKRIYALSQESGRKTAVWIKEQHPELFQHIEAEPPIKAYFPKAVYDESDEVTNETLAEIIKTASVNDAIHVYELMLKNGTEVSEENKQSLLELICFFNETEQLAEELIEERWFSQYGQERVTVRNTWRNDGYAEKLFEELPNTGKSYSAIIQGMIKYNQMEKGYYHFIKATEKGLALSIDVYHAILKATPFIKQGVVQKWEFIEETLRTMNDCGLTPNVRTLNTVLALLIRMSSFRDGKKKALKMISEVKQFGVEPSLGTYHYLLLIFCGDSADARVRCPILKDIMEQIEGKEFTIRDFADSLFFATAMEICNRYLHDINLAYRVNDLLWLGRNYNLIGNSYRESAYYRNFFTLLLQSEDLETILKFYDYYVPNIYIPEMSVLLEFINVVTMNGAVEYYSKVWTDTVRFELADQVKILERLLNGMVLNRPPQSSPPSDVALNLAETAWSIYTNGDDAVHKTPIEWTGEMLGDVMTLCLCGENFEKASAVFARLCKDESKIVGVPNFEVLDKFLDVCVVNQDLKKALNCIEYAVDNGFSDALNLGRKVARSFNLGPVYTTKLIALVGQDVLDDKEIKSQSSRSSG